MSETDPEAGALILYGIASRYVYEVIETVERAGRPVLAFVHNKPDSAPPPGLHPLYTPEQAAQLDTSRAPVIFPMITPGYRKLAEAEAARYGFTRLANLFDPTAVLARRITFGDGLLVNAGAVIGANSRFGRHVLVNRSASIGHDAVVEDYATLGPGCVLCGGCVVGRGAFIGAGACLVPGVRIGANAIVGAGAVVIAEVAPNVAVAGNPARVVRSCTAGYRDVGV